MCVYVSHVYYMYNLCIYIFGWFVSRKNICVRVLHSCLQMFNVFSWLVRHDWDWVRLYWLLLRSAQKKPGKRNECQRSQDWSLQVLQPFSHSLHLFTLGFWYLLISFDISCCNVWHVLHCLSFSCIETRLTKDRAATRALDVSTWTWGRNGDNESFENCG